jgi:tagaturonate reductase
MGFRKQMEPDKCEVMKLKRENIASITSEFVQKPKANAFSLPEKVLQFGTGVLLRGLPDYYIDKANKQNIFNGRIVVVKSTSKGGTDEFAEQDCLYTQCVKGVENNSLVEEYIINASVSRVLSASNDWSEVLKLAASKDMQIIISNTTESGIVLDKNDKLDLNPPSSFPGKLLAFLYERWKAFNGTEESGMVIVPTELISDNGTILKKIVNELAALYNVEPTFIEWLNAHNDFCNSLVDRIVPGKLPEAEQKQTEAKLGYKDDLMIMSEVYSLWAIESANEKVKNILSFAAADKGIIIAPNIEKFKELKLRLLNGSHTFSCALAFLSGFNTVKQAMQDELFSSYLKKLMTEEIAAAIHSNEISEKEKLAFADTVIDRFSNPHLDHKWLSISMNYTSKMQMRNVPLLLNYYSERKEVPQLMAIGFAAYLRFMKPVKEESGKFFGEMNGDFYLIDDVNASYFQSVWDNNDVNAVAQTVLSNKSLWTTDLTALTGFPKAVADYLQQIAAGNIQSVLKDFQTKKLRSVA